MIITRSLSDHQKNNEAKHAALTSLLHAIFMVPSFFGQSVPTPSKFLFRFLLGLDVLQANKLMKARPLFEVVRIDEFAKETLRAYYVYKNSGTN